jgi:cytochrome P450
MTAQINDIKKARDQGSGNRAKGTVFSEVLDSDIPSIEKTTARLSDEAAGIVGGGIETTKWAATVICFHVLNNPSVLERLRNDLKTAFPDGFKIQELGQLESLPYLMACVEEGMHFVNHGFQYSDRVTSRPSLILWLCNTLSAYTP